MEISKLIRRTLKLILSAAFLFVLAIAVLLGLLWLGHNRETTLPTPTGPFAISHTAYIWSDPSQPDPMAPSPNTERELFVWVWYPSAPQQPAQPPDDYLPAPWRTALKRQTGALISHFLTRDLSRVRAHSLRNADLSPQQPSYPVVFIRAGLAALTTDYTSLAEDLASHGYIVVGFDAPYRSFLTVFPDGRVIARAPQNNADLLGGPAKAQLATKLVHAWSADMTFALNQLEWLNSFDPSGKFFGRLDLQRVGVLGHSLGGATALQFCHDDPRCKAGIDVDGAPLGSVVAEGVTQPFMFLLSDHRREPETETRPVLASINSIYERLPSNARYEIMIRGANHYGFGDGAIIRSPLIMNTLHTLRILPLDGRSQLAVTRHYVSTFFDVYLKGAPASQLSPQSDYPEVEYLH